jgi:hypothetical protein
MSWILCSPVSEGKRDKDNTKIKYVSKYWTKLSGVSFR